MSYSREESEESMVRVPEDWLLAKHEADQSRQRLGEATEVLKDGQEVNPGNVINVLKSAAIDQYELASASFGALVTRDLDPRVKPMVISSAEVGMKAALELLREAEVISEMLQGEQLQLQENESPTPLESLHGESIQVGDEPETETSSDDEWGEQSEEASRERAELPETSASFELDDDAETLDLHPDIDPEIVQRILDSGDKHAISALGVLLANPKGAEFQKKELVGSNVDSSEFQKSLRLLREIPQFWDNGKLRAERRYALGEAQEEHSEDIHETTQPSPKTKQGREIQPFETVDGSDAARILKVFTDNPGEELSKNQLVSATGIKKDKIYRILSQLMNAGFGIEDNGQSTTKRRFMLNTAEVDSEPGQRAPEAELDQRVSAALDGAVSEITAAYTKEVDFALSDKANEPAGHWIHNTAINAVWVEPIHGESRAVPIAKSEQRLMQVLMQLAQLAESAADKTATMTLADVHTQMYGKGITPDIDTRNKELFDALDSLTKQLGYIRRAEGRGTWREDKLRITL